MLHGTPARFLPPTQSEIRVLISRDEATNSCPFNRLGPIARNPIDTTRKLGKLFTGALRAFAIALNARVSQRKVLQMTSMNCVRASLARLALCLGFAAAPTLLAQPANDLCSGAVPLTVNTIIYSSNATATSTNDGPATTCQANYIRSVWYRFNPAVTGAYQVSTCGSPQDTVLAVFSVVDCVTYLNAGFTAIACDDDSCATGVPGSAGNASGSTFSSIITSVTLNAGTNYYIRVSTYGAGTAVPGPFQLAVYSLSASGACCTSVGACTVGPSSSCAVALSTNNSVFMGGGTVCSPNPCQGACCVNGVGTCTITQPGAATCAAGSSFQGYNTSCSPNVCPAPPANDLCTHPTVISAAVIPVSVSGSNVGVTDTVALVPAVCIASFRDVWYSFTPTLSNNYTLTTCSAVTGNLDTILTVHDICPDAADNHALICNDDACTGGAGPSTITDFFMASGTTYLIRVATWTGATTSSGPFQLTITSGPIGACCSAAGCAINTASACTGASTYVGDGSACSTTGICVGSCCNNATGACSVTSSPACGAGSTFSGLGTTCASNPCVTQACCNAATAVCTVTGSAPCPAGTTIAIGQATCDSFVCANSHACCSQTGSCTVVGSAACPAGSSNQGIGTACTPGLCPIPNDECGTQDPIVIVGTPATGTNFAAGTSVTLTTVVGDPYCNEATFAASAADVFWRFIPTTSGDYEINTCGSNFDTALSVHAACPATDANKLACNDDSNVGGVGCISGITQSRLPHVGLAASGVYYIRVAGFNGAMGDITLNVLFNGVTGACCDTTLGTCSVVVGGAGLCPTGATYLGNNSACTQATCPIRACCNSNSGLCTTTSGATCPVGTISQGAGSTCSPNPCPAPTNDNCATVLVSGPEVTLVNGKGSVNGYLGTATPDGVFPSCGLVTGVDVWYRFTPAASGDYNVLTCNSSTVWDTTISVWSDCSTQIAGACNDDGCGVGFGHGIVGGVTLAGGTPVLIRVAAYAVDTLGIGSFTLDVVAIGACCNGSTCTAIVTGAQTGCPAGSTFQGVGSICAPTLCTGPTGVCCRGATCTTTIVSAAACTGSLIGGQSAGATFPAAANCNAPANTTTPCCYANYNKVNGISVQDIFDFLGDWFAGGPYARFGSTGAPGTLSVQNIFDFLSAWFAGGC